MKQLLEFYRSTIGKKVIVAVTGILMVGFVVTHMAGNLKMFGGCDASGVCKIDEYAKFLHSIGSDLLGYETFLWMARGGLIVTLFLHVLMIVQLRALNAAARPIGYKVGNKNKGSFSAAYMLVGGVILLGFIIFHILHFTTGTLLDGYVYGAVYDNVIKGFSNPLVVGFYIVAMIALAMHLHHGVWSVFQTLGIDNPDWNPRLRLLAQGTSAIVALGFMAVPIAVAAGMLQAQ